ncbi:MAG: XTP/dITP diphosphatase [Pseudomonadales bacterium]|nr:XTP/dITP diphosphatase [Pseudomonadales bacterium]
MEKIVLASGNKGKLKEFQQIFAQQNINVLPQAHFRIEDVEETGLTFVENAILKARNAAKISGLPALADDSGLEVDALRGKPGIYSARYAGPDATDADNNAKLLKAMTHVPEAQRTARFHCVLVLMRHAEDPTPMIFHGQWEGMILTQPYGTNGFGYDPLFYALEQKCCSAQLPSELKNKVSHRGLAVEKLIAALQP